LLTMGQLENMFKSDAFSHSPVELLTLSACETATGDDRSPLGLSGIALKSGARSTLGSLWPLSDRAAKEMLPIFYRQYIIENTSKAEALRKAQVSLIHSSELKHPVFWAPFLLIGNWL
jgi:CHAT domain-containing protein